MIWPMWWVEMEVFRMLSLRESEKVSTMTLLIYPSEARKNKLAGERGGRLEQIIAEYLRHFLPSQSRTIILGQMTIQKQWIAHHGKTLSNH